MAPINKLPQAVLCLAFPPCTPFFFQDAQRHAENQLFKGAFVWDSV